MRIGVGDTESKYNFVDKWGVAQLELAGAEIIARLKHQFVDAGLEIIGIENRRVQATIGVGAILF
jgi:hypothetical protein